MSFKKKTLVQKEFETTKVPKKLKATRRPIPRPSTSPYGSVLPLSKYSTVPAMYSRGESSGSASDYSGRKKYSGRSSKIVVDDDDSEPEDSNDEQKSNDISDGVTKKNLDKNSTDKKPNNKASTSTSRARSRPQPLRRSRRIEAMREAAEKKRLLKEKETADAIFRFVSRTNSAKTSKAAASKKISRPSTANRKMSNRLTGTKVTASLSKTARGKERKVSNKNKANRNSQRQAVESSAPKKRNVRSKTTLKSS